MKTQRMSSLRIVCTKEQRKEIASFRRNPQRPRIQTVFSASDGTHSVLVLRVPDSIIGEFTHLLGDIGIKHAGDNSWRDTLLTAGQDPL